MSTSPSPWRRFQLDISNGATWGATLATIVVAVHWWQSVRGPVPSAAERVLLAVLGSAPELTFRPVFVLGLLGGYRVVAPLLLWLLWWRRSRRLTLAGLRVSAQIGAGLVAVFAVGVAYVLRPSLGPLPTLAALPIAVWVVRMRRWPGSATLAFASAFAIGTLVTQGFYSLPFQDAFVRMLHPAWGFVPPVLLGTVAAAALRRFRPAVAAEQRLGLLHTWGLLVVVTGCATAVGIELHGVRARQPEPAGSRILDDWAYDVLITGDPPQLVWTDRQRIQVLADPYGAAMTRYAVDEDEAYYVERIWGQPNGGFYIQGNNKIERWDDPRGTARISYRPRLRFRSPDWLRHNSSSLWTVAEDPVGGRVFTVSEYDSHWGAFDLASGELVGRGVLSPALWPFWHFTADVAGRLIYATSALDDGGLYRIGLDDLKVARLAGGLYLYETVLDREANLLWGVRPLSGEVVAVDTRDFGLRHRIPVAFGLRDLQRDPGSGDLFTCSEFSGDIFRVDGDDLEVRRIGWCGRLCRGMYLDRARGTLWVGTRDGVCRIPVAPAGVMARP